MAPDALPPDPPAAIQELRDLAWARAPADRIAAGLNHPDGAVQAEALRLLGQLDAEVDAWLVPHLTHADPTHRRAAAEALALSPGDPDALLTAWSALATAGRRRLKRDEVGPALLDGLGRRGDHLVIPTLVEALSLPPSHAIPAAHALGRLGRRQVAGAPAAIPPLVRCASFEARPLATACGWALARIGMSAASDEDDLALAAGAEARGSPWEVRALATRRVAPSWAWNHPDRRVRVAALTGPHVPAARVVPRLADPDPWVAEQARLAAAGLPLAEVEAPLRDLLLRTGAPELAATLAALGARPSEADLSDSRPEVQAAWYAAAPVSRWLDLLKSAPGPSSPRGPASADELRLLGMITGLEARKAEVLADPLAPALRDALAGHPHPWARAAAPALIPTTDVEALARLIADGDPEVAHAALLALEERKAELADPSAVDPEVSALLRHPWPHLRAAAARILKATPDPTSPPISPPERRPRAAPAEAPDVVVTTTRGTLRIQLDPQVAPAGVGAFLELAPGMVGQRFHRVVPAFVVQTGDPTGTGWGGPGFTLPDENSLRPYTAGAVGFAKSVRDDAGSQWFITTEDQPHLTGNYTWIGRVVGGLDVARSIRVGDQIVAVELDNRGR